MARFATSIDDEWTLNDILNLLGDDGMAGTGRPLAQIPLGTRFGRLETVSSVFAKTRPNGKDREGWVRLRCDCGAALEVRSHLLGYGKDETVRRYQRSCGCLRNEKSRERGLRRGPESASWRGGRSTDGQGYVKIWVGEGNHPRARKSAYVAEHILVMERRLGRYLHPDEEVHHKNGVRDDNASDNLELWSTSQPAGQRVEDKLAWAKEMIDRYAFLDDDRAAG